MASLQNLDGPVSTEKSAPPGVKTATDESAAFHLVQLMDVPINRKTLLLNLAERYDDGTAFPKISDVRSVLLSHHQNAKDLKTRIQAFKRLLPVLSAMSEKGLEKLISRAHHSGPAELGAISEAIRGAGEDLRGAHRASQSAPADTKGRPSPSDPASAEHDTSSGPVIDGES